MQINTDRHPSNIIFAANLLWLASNTDNFGVIGNSCSSSSNERTSGSFTTVGPVAEKRLKRQKLQILCSILGHSFLKMNRLKHKATLAALSALRKLSRPVLMLENV